MNTRIRKCAILLLGTVTLACSQAAWSLGLGDARVESFLNQPLVTKIELITKPSDDLATISASLASAADYELIGASLDDISVPLAFSIEGSGGQAHIAVTSTYPISDPVVRLIIEVNWTGGRMLREYTLFLDPPTFSQPAPAPRIEPARPAAADQTAVQEQAAPQASDEAAPQRAVPQSTAPAGRDTAALGTDDYGPVQSGDTLWRIAKDWSEGSGHNLNKVMLAIQRKNPRAFSRNNINLLQRGAILRMPDVNEIDSMSASAASQEVTDQDLANQTRRNMASTSTPLLSDESAAPAPALSEEPQELAAESDSAESESAATDLASDDPLALDTEPQLELVPPSEDSAVDSAYGFEESEDGSEAAVTAQSLREELARKEEELITQQQQNAYLENRLSELESQLAESREGTLDDENLSSMEERLREERLAAAEEAGETASEEPAEEVSPPAAKQEAVIPKVSTSQQKKEPWYSGMMLWLIGLLVLAAIVAGWLMSRRGGSDDTADMASDADDAQETLREIADEAKDVLKVLDSGESSIEDTVAADDVADEIDAEAAASEESQETPVKSSFPAADEEAELLDEDSADPEIQLDLARAYISMGDKEAARVILEEVIAHGSEDQQAEASKMKDFL